MDKVRDVLSSLGRNKKGPKRKPKHVVCKYSGGEHPPLDDFGRILSPEDITMRKKNITSVRFSKGVQKIGNKAFHNFTSLESITLPSTVKLRLVRMHFVIATI